MIPLATRGLFAVVAQAPVETPGFEKLPFAFRLDQADSGRYGNPRPTPDAVGAVIEFRVEGDVSEARFDVFDSVGGAWPRWRWRAAKTTRGNRASIGGTPGVETLVVVRRPGRKDYQVGGPF